MIPAVPPAREVTTAPILVTGPNLTVSLDVLGAAGSASIGVIGEPGLQASELLTSNATDQLVPFPNGKNLDHLVGRNVTLRLVLNNAMVFTLGFCRPASRGQA